MAAFRAIGAVVSSTATSQTVKTPASTVVGDMLVAAVLVDGAKVEPTMAGWTKLGQENSTVGEAQTTAWFWKVATEAGEKGHAIAWGGASRYNAAQIAVVKEAGSSAPVFAAKANASSTSMKFASAAAPAANSVSVLMGGIDQTGTGTPPANWTERQDNTVGIYIATRDNPPAEATGEQTVTLSTARVTNTGHIIVRPEAAKTSEGQAKGKAKFTAVAKGIRTRLGKAIGALSLKGLVGGLRNRRGAAVGTVTFDAVAGGQVIPDEPEGEHRMDNGFLRDEQRRLVVALEGDGVMNQGLLRDSEGRLLVALAGEGLWDQGFLRDDERHLLVSEDAEGARMNQGFLRTDDGRLVVTEDATGATMDQGFLKAEDGRLVVAGL